MKQLKKYLKKITVFVQNLLFRKREISRVNKNDIKNVLVLGYTGLGNFILYTPALKSIKNYIPDAEYTFLHGGDTSCYKVLKGSNFFDEEIIVDRNASWRKRLKIIYKVKKRRFDLIISEFHNNIFFMALIVFFSGAKYKVGHISSPGWDNVYDFLYNLPVKMKEDQHEIDRYLSIAYKLGVPKKNIEKEPYIYLYDKDRKEADRIIKKHIKKHNKKIKNVISCQICVKYPWQRKRPTEKRAWPINDFKIVLKKVSQNTDSLIILHGTSKEKEYIEQFFNGMDEDILLLAGKTTLKEAAAIIEKSDLFIGLDSGLMHIAHAVKTPIVAVYGPSDYRRTKPINRKSKVIRKDLECSPCWKMNGPAKMISCPNNYKCLEDISVNEVYNIVYKKLST